MVSLSNHEALRTNRYAKPSWFDKLTMKTLALKLAFSPDSPALPRGEEAAPVIPYAIAHPGGGPATGNRAQRK